MAETEGAGTFSMMDALTGIANAMEVLKGIGEAGIGLRTSLQAAGWSEETAEEVAAHATMLLMEKVIDG